MSDNLGINLFLGKTITEIFNKNDEIVFTVDDGTQYKMYHSQDCCEYVTVEDIVGDLTDLIGSPIIRAEERTNSGSESDTSDWPSGIEKPEYIDSYTWTFYDLSTIKGSVTIRWYGSSNGYYSESVSFVTVGGKNDY